MKLFPFLLVCLAISTPAYGASHILKDSTGDWPPHLSQKMNNGGPLLDKINQAFALEDTQLDVQWYPWKRAKLLVKANAVDVSFPWSKVAKSEEVFYFSDPVLESRVAFFHLKSVNFSWQDYKDLKGKTIGGMLGYSSSEILGALAKQYGFTFNPVISEMANLKKLLLGRIDAFPCNVDVCMGLINTMPKEQADQLTFNDQNYLWQHKLYLIVSKTNPNAQQILERFNRGWSQVDKP